MLRSVLAGADAIRDAYPAVAVAGERESGQLLAEVLDAVEAVEVADSILRHGGLPFINTSKQRCDAEAEDLLQFVADDGDDGIVGKLPEVFGVRSGEEAAQKGAILWGSVGKFIVNESGGQQALAFATRDEKSEAGRERLADFAVIAEADSDRGAVANCGKFGRKFGAAG